MVINYLINEVNYKQKETKFRLKKTRHYKTNTFLAQNLKMLKIINKT